jgi:Tfp pilus assembly protein PilF
LGKRDEAARELALAENARRRRDLADAAIASTQSGIGQLERGEIDAAIEQFRAVIASEPGFAPAYYQLSLALQKLGKDKDAGEALKGAESRDPGLRFCRSSLGLRSWLRRRPLLPDK